MYWHHYDVRKERPPRNCAARCCGIPTCPRSTCTCQWARSFSDGNGSYFTTKNDELVNLQVFDELFDEHVGTFSKNIYGVM